MKTTHQVGWFLFCFPSTNPCLCQSRERAGASAQLREARYGGPRPGGCRLLLGSAGYQGHPLLAQPAPRFLAEVRRSLFPELTGEVIVSIGFPESNKAWQSESHLSQPGSGGCTAQARSGGGTAQATIFCGQDARKGLFVSCGHWHPNPIFFLWGWKPSALVPKRPRGAPCEDHQPLQREPGVLGLALGLPGAV